MGRFLSLKTCEKMGWYLQLKKNQGRCGSCWTFFNYRMLRIPSFIETSQVSTIIRTKSIWICAQDYDTHDCNGGLLSHECL